MSSNDLDRQIDIARCVASGQLEVMSSSATYLRSGSFSSQEMLSLLGDTLGPATKEAGFPFARATGEVHWSLNDYPQREELLCYESELNRFARRYPQALLCLYDLNYFDGGILKDLLATHSKMLFGNLVAASPCDLDDHARAV